MLRKIWPIVLITAVTITFFYKVVFLNLVPLPSDMLVGAYYPWIEQKTYGYTTNVPIKNPLISDVFSEIFVWKKLIYESYQSRSWPLWNPNMYSGYPLLANFQSAALSVFNIFFIIFGLVDGWSIYLIVGVFLSAFTMYWLLRTLKYSQWASLIGAISYAFSSYSLAWLEFCNAQSLIYLPLLILFIEKYFETKKNIWIMLISPVIFFLATAGHFQIFVYGLVLSSIYFVCKLFQYKTQIFSTILIYFVALILGLLISSIQLLPTLEMSQLSIRNSESQISGLNFGLFPWKNFVTLLIPDYFGNPTTGNYWGILNYHETILYSGILAVFAVIWGITNWRRLGNSKFFLITAIISLLLCFDNPVAKTVYWLKIPFISTSGAGRIVILFTFATSVLMAKYLDSVRSDRLRKIVFNQILVGTIFVTIICFTYLYKVNLTITIRNSIWPAFIIVSFGISLLFRKNKYFYLLIVTLLVADLFRWGWKYVPFTPKNYIFPKTSTTEYLTNDHDLFRVDREVGPIMPPNTWSYYNFMSPSGYDPLAPLGYTRQYNSDLNNEPNKTSRYAELFSYDAKRLGEFNVKYLLVLKNQNATKPVDLYNYKINLSDWVVVNETNSTAILKNKFLKPRFEVEASGQATLSSYKPSRVEFKYSNVKPSHLILRDAWYPGWQVFINEEKQEIIKYNGVFRQVILPAGSGNIEFVYQPNSFYYGLIISFVAIGVWILTMLILVTGNNVKITSYANPK